MDIKTFTKDMTKEALDAFAMEAGTSAAYIKQLASGHRKAGAKSLSGIILASGGAIKLTDLRPDFFNASS